MVDEHLISLQPGTVIAGRYEVVKCLGAGSMGLVYACRHQELSGHLVAVKVLFPEVARDRIAAARFRYEIFAAYGVSHPNVVRAYEFLRDGDIVAYTMEYVDGGDLATRLAEDEPIPIDETVRILTQMCSGVQAIHDAGIVHRDLKPENILLTDDGTVKIVDFGIARTGHGPKLTEHGGVVGTIDYVSPEYMLNSQVDWRSDIYAMGILAYEMVAGDSPFRADSVYATMTKRLKNDPAPPSSVRAECPPELDKIILRAMERDPEARYQSAAEMFYDLSPLAGEEVISSGSYLRISKPSSENYVGPTETDAAEVHDREVGGAVDDTATDEESTRDVSAKKTTEFRFDEHDDEAAAFHDAETQVIPEHSPEAVVRYEEEATIYEPVRMQRVLEDSGRDAQDDWDSTSRSSINVSRSGIDQTRLQNLAHRVERVQHSKWVDLLTALVAVLIGLGVGFFILRLFVPDLVHSGTLSEVSERFLEVGK